MLKRHQVLLHSGDWDRLRSLYVKKKPTEVIRDLVRGHCDRVEAKLREIQKEEKRVGQQ